MDLFYSWLPRGHWEISASQAEVDDLKTLKMGCFIDGNMISMEHNSPMISMK